MKLRPPDPASIESGVSPVIGVMLMIVVTIIIAAVVSAFAGGMNSAVKASPTSIFEFQIYSKYSVATYGGAYPYITAILKNGETLNTEDLKIISTCKYGGDLVYRYTFDPAGNATQKAGQKQNPGGSSGPQGFRSSAGLSSHPFGIPGSYWMQGDIYSGSPKTVLGITPTQGSIVRIEVVDKATNTVIYQTEVTVL